MFRSFLALFFLIIIIQLGQYAVLLVMSPFSSAIFGCSTNINKNLFFFYEIFKKFKTYRVRLQYFLQKNRKNACWVISFWLDVRSISHLQTFKFANRLMSSQGLMFIIGIMSVYRSCLLIIGNTDLRF